MDNESTEELMAADLPPRVRRYARTATYKDSKNNVLEFKARKKEDHTFTVLVSYKKVGLKRQRGCLDMFATQAEADARFDEWVTQAENNGWKKAVKPVRQDFDMTSFPIAEN